LHAVVSNWSTFSFRAVWYRALISINSHSKRTELFWNVCAGNRVISDVGRKLLEKLLEEPFQDSGCQVEMTGYAADGCVVVVLRRSGVMIFCSGKAPGGSIR
jgi:hypothetical protein